MSLRIGLDEEDEDEGSTLSTVYNMVAKGIGSKGLDRRKGRNQASGFMGPPGGLEGWASLQRMIG